MSSREPASQWAPAESQLTDLDRFRRFVKTRLGTVSYLDAGAGPVALFIHGVATNAHLWRRLIGSLAGDERRCIAVDLPLHGQSPANSEQRFGLSAFAQLLEEVCAELQLTDIDLVAHDTGGAIAQVFAARSSGRLRTLALTNCETHDNLPPTAFKPTVLLARAGVLAFVGPQLRRNLVWARRLMFARDYENPEALPEEVVRSFVYPTLGTRERARRFQQWLLSLDAADLLAIEPSLRRLDVPTLIVWGTDDRFFDLKWAYWLAATLPNVTGVVEIPGGRLFFPDERAHELEPHLQRLWQEATSVQKESRLGPEPASRSRS